MKGVQTLVLETFQTQVCGNEARYTTGYSQNLTASPYLFSKDNNVLVVSGCGGGVQLKDKNGETVSGCATICTKGTVPGINCYGEGCCQMTIPYSLEYYRYEFVTMHTVRAGLTNNDYSSCAFGVLVDSTWIVNRNISKINENEDSVPVVLEWSIKDLPINSPSYANSSCVNKTESVYEAGGLVCRCKHDYFEGNPYLPYGCQVVKECEKCVEDCMYFDTNHTYGCPQKQKHFTETETTRAFALGLDIMMLLVLALFGAFGMYHMIQRRRNNRLKAKYFERNGGLILMQEMCSEDTSNVERTRLFTSDEFDKATDSYNKDRILGEGGQGTVYKGMLSDGKIIAIKKSKIIDGCQLKIFINEKVVLSQINHRNVVKLLGCCLETQVPMLVYEYVSNGTLSDLLHAPRDDFPITWEMRLQIATDIANALAYLHSSYLIPIFHRDIKSSNILLDSRYRAKLSDFGISKPLSIDQTHITTRVVGTFGYLDPEYFQSNQFTDKSDVYSFGIVLDELLTGQKAVCSIDKDEGRSLVTWFLTHMENDSLFDILDGRVAREGGGEEIEGVAHLAKRCLKMDGRRRPSMKEVAAKLETIRSSMQQKFTRNGSILSIHEYDASLCSSTDITSKV
ncbi:putative wall-associated receptor kinase-like 16 [Amaranthus tricolor]|uniref:putative wall-associated receptor kinase-like 16 n=1 Tax=Amaranthus tricolor TaxID=29722 RepID=UPI00258C081A|nr:putative wall-associated receptor kinase-like 16 [Amaranthus tricolor]